MQKRIEYIDAMRGFTMLLVVINHVTYFGYEQYNFMYEHSFNAFFVLFRMPLFFFISGFIFFRRDKIDTIGNCVSVLKKKAIVQLIPTIFFLCIYTFLFDYWIVDAFCDSYKLGYWFTVALFECFCLFILLNIFAEKGRVKGGYRIFFFLSIALVIRFVCSYSFWNFIGVELSPVFGVLGLNQMKYFIYFVAGALVKEYWDNFNKLMQDKHVIAILILLFFGIVIFALKVGYHTRFNIIYEHIFLICSGGMGVILTFLFFQKNSVYFSKQTYLGRLLQYIGRRTLDIYLLHYFLLPRGLQELGSYFETHQNYCIEFVISILISAIVVAICLLVSHVIRMSPVLGRLLFGAKDADSNTW